ncbi:hypothetical protein MMAN_26650 [Mycobacterium mantenii]|uniref:Uncharacterized protein n=1 Tax=Mycobacterium mantenii TaxID=560555 RepID=A0ABN6AA75_MYCNT|nr:hypothetical protein MMAN_26650 [Mycobacterium mantenii]
MLGRSSDRLKSVPDEVFRHLARPRLLLDRCGLRACVQAATRPREHVSPEDLAAQATNLKEELLGSHYDGPYPGPSMTLRR